jgi:polysaccharide biosynthesis PFTS motif protein
MKKNMFKKILKKIKNFYNIKTINGYRKAKREKKLKELEVIKDELTGLELNISNKKLELSLRQFLLRYLINQRFNIAIFHAINDDRPIIYPLPKEWILLLRKKGFRVNFLLSSILLYILSIFFFLKSFKTFFNYLIYFNDNFPKSEYVYFNNLENRHLPNNETNSFTILNWFKSQYKKKNDNVSILLNLEFIENKYTKNFNIFYSKYMFPSLNFKKKIFFLFHFFQLISKNLVNIIIFNWHKLLLSEEFIHQIYVRNISKNELADEYWFSISEFIYRPIWTYEVENSSKVILFNYSCSFYGHKLLNEYLPEEVGIRSMNWPFIFQWSEKYMNFLKEKNKENIKFKLVKPIWWGDKNISLNLNSTKKSVALFDSTPSNFLRMCELNASQYRSNKCGKNFINDIIKLSKFYNLEVYYKIKKTIDKRYHSKIFQSYIDEIVKTNEINFIDWDVSPFKLIKNTTINISIPFTSTALVGQYYNKPSCYYDPIMVLEENDRASQSVELIKGKDNLSNWIERNIKD